jgi:hypothetical protein
VNIYPFIEAEKAQQRNVKRACELLKVSRAACCAARDGQPSDRDRQDAELTVLITAEHKRRVARLMRQHGLRGRAPKRWKKTTIPDPAAAARADAIRRDFTADAAKINARWCGDITYIDAAGGDVGDVDGRQPLVPHRQVERVLVHDRMDFAEVHLHELAWP